VFEKTLSNGDETELNGKPTETEIRDTEPNPEAVLDQDPPLDVSHPTLPTNQPVKSILDQLDDSSSGGSTDGKRHCGSSTLNSTNTVTKTVNTVKSPTAVTPISPPSEPVMG